MANIKTLKDLTPGTVFDAGPIDVRVLDHMTNGATLLIADKAVAWRPFSLEPLKTRPEEAPTPYGARKRRNFFPKTSTFWTTVFAASWTA